MESIVGYSIIQPNSFLALDEFANSVAGSPGRLGLLITKIFRPVTRSTALITSRLELGLPVPKL